MHLLHDSSNVQGVRVVELGLRRRRRGERRGNITGAAEDPERHCNGAAPRRQSRTDWGHAWRDDLTSLASSCHGPALRSPPSRCAYCPLPPLRGSCSIHSPFRRSSSRRSSPPPQSPPSPSCFQARLERTMLTSRRGPSTRSNGWPHASAARRDGRRALASTGSPHRRGWRARCAAGRRGR